MIHTYDTFYGAQIIFNERHNKTFLEFADYPRMNGLPVSVTQYITEGDRRILEAARISYDPTLEGLTEPERDQKLVKYLSDHKHSSPFQHVMYTFTLVIPVFVKSQAERHRTFDFTYWQVNEQSRRYTSDDIKLARHDVPWRLQNTSGNKQGSGSQVDQNTQHDIELTLKVYYERSLQIYNWLVHQGVALEQARQILPQSMMCTMLCTVDLWNLIHFIMSRCDPAAQREIRVLAYILKNKIVPKMNPWVSGMITKWFEEKEWPNEYE